MDNRFGLIHRIIWYQFNSKLVKLIPQADIITNPYLKALWTNTCRISVWRTSSIRTKARINRNPNNHQIRLHPRNNRMPNWPLPRVHQPQLISTLKATTCRLVICSRTNSSTTKWAKSSSREPLHSNNKCSSTSICKAKWTMPCTINRASSKWSK